MSPTFLPLTAGQMIKLFALPTLTALILLNSATTLADGNARQYDIPAQSLNNALMQFAADSDLKLLLTADTVRGMTTNGLVGSMTQAQALSKLLQGSGMTYRFVDAKTVTLEPVPSNFKKTAVVNEKPEPQSNKNDTGDGQMMPKVTVEADSANPYDDPNWATDPYNTDYTRPNSTTATKTDTPIFDTPASIQIVPRQVIKDQQAITMQDALNNVSGVFADHSSQGGSFAPDTFLIRGFPTQNTGFTSAYRDGYLSILGGSFSLANVEQFEVLKGPAAFLYGRLEPGGLINIVSKRPQALPYYSLQQQFGSYNQFRTLADATGPLTNDGSLAYRLNFEYLTSDSFRDFQFTDRKFLAPSLTWRISDKTSVDLDFLYQNEASRPDPGLPVIGGKPDALPKNRWIGEPTDRFSTEYYATSVTLKHQFTDDWKAAGRFAYTKDIGIDNFQIFPAGPLDENPNSPTYGVLQRGYFNFPDSVRDTYFSTINITGKFKTAWLDHTLLIGGDYFNRKVGDSRTGVFTLPGDPDNTPPLNLFNPVYGMAGFDASKLPPPFDPFDSKQDWWGIYLQDQIAITDKLQLLLGGRFDEASLQQGTDPEVIDREFSQRYGLLYHPVPWLALYGSYAEGFNAANSGRVLTGKPAPVLSQQYEAGIKGEWFDKRLNASLAFYELTKTNVSVPVKDQLLAARGFVDLVGEARSQGIELDVAGQVTPDFRLIATYSLTDAVTTNDRDDSGGLGNTGKRLAAVPRHAGSFWGTYDFSNLGATGFSSGLGVYVVGKRAGNNENTYDLPGYVRLDAMLKYSKKVGLSTVSAQFNVQNLLDKDYFSTGGGSGYAIPASPRTFLGSIQVEF